MIRFYELPSQIYYILNKTCSYNLIIRPWSLVCTEPFTLFLIICLRKEIRCFIEVEDTGMSESS